MNQDQETADAAYRALIDDLVEDCRHGQGQIASDRVRRGVWNASLPVDVSANDAELNKLVAALSVDHRELVAQVLVDQYVAGVHGALVALHVAEIPPFDKGYWDPFHDFVGRLDDWEWPVGEERS